jgi:hypothetical protein
MSDALKAVTANLEERIAEIDRQLADVEPLQREREHLERALAEVTAVSTSDADARPRPAAAKSQRGSTRKPRGSGRKSQATRVRAPQGANREVILSFLRENGASTAPAIAKATSLSRGVVYNNLSKLTAEGATVKNDDDGTASFTLADA